jgi:hypothetical protein
MMRTRSSAWTTDHHHAAHDSPAVGHSGGRHLC